MSDGVKNGIIVGGCTLFAAMVGGICLLISTFCARNNTANTNCSSEPSGSNCHTHGIGADATTDQHNNPNANSHTNEYSDTNKNTDLNTHFLSNL